MTFAAARKIALSTPGVEEGTSWGVPAFNWGGRMVACTPTHRSAEPGSLAVSVSFERREELLAEAPVVYYVKEHYLNYPVVLVRLANVSPEALAGLIKGAVAFVRDTSGSKRRRSSPVQRS